MPTHEVKVFLAGAGPGRWDLITLRAAELLKRAEVVLYDALVDPELLRMAPQAEHIFTGKKAGGHSLLQEDINRLLIEQAQTGRCVLRLKGGDPFVFGRGGEEALALRAAGIPFEIVPGVTAGIAGPAFAGIPVTHRGLSQSVTFITAHSAATDTPGTTLNLADVARDGTLVFYMGVRALPRIIQEVLAIGRPPSTPVAVIEAAAFARQRVITGTLDNIAAQAEEAQVQAPALILVGAVAALREQLHWFCGGALAGLRVAVTHRATQGSGLGAMLSTHGAEVLYFPTVNIAAPVADIPVEQLTGYDWILLTSPNAADQLFSALQRHGLDARALAGARICAIGHATAQEVEKRHVLVDAHVTGFEPETTAAALGPLQGKRVLLPRADIARGRLARHLETVGANVTELVAYRTEEQSVTQDQIDELLRFAPQVIAFTNSGAARNFARILGAQGLAQLARTAYAAIGPVTSQAARESGLEIAIEPQRHEAAALFEAIAAWHNAEGGQRNA